MDNLQKKKLMTYAYWIMIIVVVAFCVYLFFYLKSNARQCIANPFIFGAERIGDVYCNCMQFKAEGIPSHFSFNETTFTS